MDPESRFVQGLWVDGYPKMMLSWVQTAERKSNPDPKHRMWEDKAASFSRACKRCTQRRQQKAKDRKPARRKRLQRGRMKEGIPRRE